MYEDFELEGHVDEENVDAQPLNGSWVDDRLLDLLRLSVDKSSATGESSQNMMHSPRLGVLLEIEIAETSALCWTEKNHFQARREKDSVAKKVGTVKAHHSSDHILLYSGIRSWNFLTT